MEVSYTIYHFLILTRMGHKGQILFFPYVSGRTGLSEFGGVYEDSKTKLGVESCIISS